MTTKYSYLTDKELIAVLRDSESEWVRELCERLAAALDEIKNLENGRDD